MHRKGLVIGILTLMLGVNIGSSFAGDVDVKTMSSVVFDGNTLYVGGSGPNNYTKIQDAIDNASDGDTVFVYSGHYYQQVNVDKSISLIGENVATTVIDSYNEYFRGIVNISADRVMTTGFFIIYNRSYRIHAGGPILINSDNNNISGNYLKGGSFGVYIKNSSNNSICNNNIFHTESGVFLSYSYDNFISGNIIDGDGYGSGGGIEIVDSYCNIISFNDITNNSCGRGVWLVCSNQNIISKNNIKSNLMGIHLQWSHRNEIISNNFQKNCGGAAYFEEGGITNIWDGNYWNRPRFLPKLVFGDIWIMNWFIPCFKIDWHPAKEPYDIGGGYNEQ